MIERNSENSKRRAIASLYSPFCTLGPLTTDITEDVRKYAAEQAISEDEAWKKGMEEPSAARSTIQRIAREGGAQRSQKSKEFVEKGAEVYAKA